MRTRGSWREPLLVQQMLPAQSGLRILALTQQVRAIHTNVAPIKTPLELNAKSSKLAWRSIVYN
jgi:hypothetical protein